MSDGQLTRALQLQHQQTLAALRDHRSELQELRSDLKRQRAGGGFPWGLVLLVGAGYALYRSNPGVRDRLHGLLGQLDPGIQGNLNRAGEAVKDAASDLADGRTPADAFRRTAGEVQRAGEKAVDSARDTWEDVKDGARHAAADVRSRQDGGDR